MLEKFFGGWTLFERLFLGLVWVLPTILGVIFKSSVVEILAAALSLTCALLLAKGKISGYFVGLIAVAFFSVVCFQTKVFGEVFVQLALYLPLYVFAIYSWARNKVLDKDKGQVVKVGYVGVKEILIVLLSQAVMGVGYYFILQAFNTEFLLFSTISVIAQVIATYLLARRNQFGLAPYIVGDIVQIVLWIMVIAGGNTGAIAILVMPCLYLVNDVYGFFSWRELEKRQERKLAPSLHQRVLK